MLKQRALILTSRFPYPPISGGKLTLLNFARALKSNGVALLSLCSTKEEMSMEPSDDTFDEIHRIFLPRSRSYLSSARALLSRKPLQLAYYESAAFRKMLGELLPRYSIVIAHLIRCGQYIDAPGTEIPRVLLMSDAISMAYSRMGNQSGAPPLWRLLYRLERNRLLQYEKTCAARYDQIWLHSEVDRQFLDLNESKVRVLPVGINLTDFPYNPKRDGNVIAFVGNMSFSLNHDACRNFVREIFPSLRSGLGLRFRIVGACPPAVQREFARVPGVEVTGTVTRIADAVGSDVFCGVCPIRGGAGIQNKVLNYFALGVPCVSSQVAATGIDALDGRDLLVYHSPEQAVALIEKLYFDPDLCMQLSAQGRAIVTANHDWHKIQASVRYEVDALLARTNPCKPVLSDDLTDRCYLSK